MAATIQGTVQDGSGAPLFGANIVLEGESRGASTDLDGAFAIANVPPGVYTLNVTMVGYTPRQREVALTEQGADLTLTLEFDPVALEDLVFKAERQSSSVRVDEPVRVEVVSSEDLERESTDGGVLTALGSKTGLNTRPCALCGSAGVGMQGLDPSYTEVLMDGMPVLKGVGSLYGLDGVAVSDLSRVEITKGSGSSSSGTDAMAGSVNLVSRDPLDTRALDLSMTGSSTLRHGIAVNLTYPTGKLKSRIGVNYGSEPRKVDVNSDNITDTPSYDRLSGAVRTTYDLGRYKVVYSGRGLMENRFAGEVDWTERDRGSADVYGRDIAIQRNEHSLSYTLPGIWSLQTSLVRHQQDSWYGETRFDAGQLISVTFLQVEQAWTERHATNLRLEYRYEQYEDNLQLASPTDRTDRVPGLMVQQSYRPSDVWLVTYGGRAERYAEDPLVVSPRGSIRFRPKQNWTFLAAAGTGYRPVTIFSLDKAVHAGFDNVVVPEALEPERSLGSTFTINYRRATVGHALQIDLTGYYTHFDNKVVLSYGDEAHSETVYSNADMAFTRGVELQTTVTTADGWSLSAGGSVSDVQYRDTAGWRLMQMQNRYTGLASITKAWSDGGWAANVDANLYGPMALPEGRGRSDSPAYTTVDVGLSKQLGAFTVSGSVQNLLDYTQPDTPLKIDPVTGEPRFDAAMIYGPLLGRLFLLNIRSEFQL